MVPLLGHLQHHLFHLFHSVEYPLWMHWKAFHHRLHLVWINFCFMAWYSSHVDSFGYGWDQENRTLRVALRSLHVINAILNSSKHHSMFALRKILFKRILSCGDREAAALKRGTQWSAFMRHLFFLSFPLSFCVFKFGFEIKHLHGQKPHYHLFIRLAECSLDKYTLFRCTCCLHIL